MTMFFALFGICSATYNLHSGYYGWALFWALWTQPFLIQMGLMWFVGSFLQDYVLKPMSIVDALMKEKEAEKKDA